MLGFFALFNDLFQPLPPDEALKLIEDNNIRIDFNETTNFRLILSLREDFLARLEDYSYNIPFLKKNRVGVSPMNGLQALEVVLKPIPDIMDRRAALKILEKVSKCPHIKDDEEVLEDLSIETCILSLFCLSKIGETVPGSTSKSHLTTSRELSMPLICGDEEITRADMAL